MNWKMRNTGEKMYLEAIDGRWCYQVYPDMDSDQWIAHREPDGGWRLTQTTPGPDEALRIAQNWFETRADDPDNNPEGPFAQP
jgi:hypothetical protein